MGDGSVKRVLAAQAIALAIGSSVASAQAQEADGDHDGVPDRLDDCPAVAAPHAFRNSGCPPRVTHPIPPVTARPVRHAEKGPPPAPAPPPPIPEAPPGRGAPPPWYDPYANAPYATAPPPWSPYGWSEGEDPPGPGLRNAGMGITIAALASGFIGGGAAFHVGEGQGDEIGAAVIGISTAAVAGSMLLTGITLWAVGAARYDGGREAHVAPAEASGRGGGVALRAQF